MAIASKSSKAAIALAIAAWFCGLAPFASAAEWVYTVRPGDEIWNIASRYCGSATYADRIIEFNKLPNERLIRPGARLRIPVEWLVRQPATAKVLNVRGTATLLTPDPEPVRVGREIEMGYRLHTQDGTAVVGFADGSSLIVAAESEVLFNVLTAYGDTGMVDTNLRFYRGRGTSRIIRRNDASSFRISTPAGTAAVRGTEFRIAVEGEQSLTETLAGEVGFIADTETPVPAGFGVAASPTGVLREPLLPAPVWISTAGRFSTDSEITWRAQADARAYRTSVYLASELETPVRVSTTAETSLRLDNLALGSYVVAVRGISASDLEGYEASLAIDLISEAPILVSSSTQVAGGTTLSWQGEATATPYSIEVARDESFREIVWQGQSEGLSAEPSLLPGRYFWRVQSATSDFSLSAGLTVRPATPAGLTTEQKNMTLALRWSPSAADAYRIRISRDAAHTSPLIETSTSESRFEQALQAAGTHYIELVAVENGIDSEPATVEARLVRRPWWLLGLLVVPLLL